MRKPDKEDLNIIEKIDNMKIPYYILRKLPQGDKIREAFNKGFNYVHHFIQKNSLLSSTEMKMKIIKLLFIFTAIITNLSKTARYKFKRSGNVPMTGTIYISSLPTETNVLMHLKEN